MKYLIILMLSSSFVYGQAYFDKTYSSTEIHHVVVDNFEGNISVKRSNNADIKITAMEGREVGSTVLKLKEFVKDDLVYIYIENPCKQRVKDFDPEDPFRSVRTTENCNWDREVHSFPILDYMIEIPDGVNIYVSTIMDSEIEINNIAGNIHATNVNGPITMSGIKSVKRAETVNGDIEIDFVSKPIQSGSFSTINGKITIQTPEDSSITTRFKSYMGEMFTDFEANLRESNRNETDKINAGEKLKIEEYSEATIGKGEVTMTISTFNSNAYLLKKEN